MTYDSEKEINAEMMVPGERYLVQYGTTQRRPTSIGTKNRLVTVDSQGLSSEMDLYREGTPVHKGVWVIDHSDSDRKKFFFFFSF